MLKDRLAEEMDPNRRLLFLLEMTVFELDRLAPLLGISGLWAARKKVMEMADQNAKMFKMVSGGRPCPRQPKDPNKEKLVDEKRASMGLKKRGKK